MENVHRGLLFVVVLLSCVVCNIDAKIDNSSLVNLFIGTSGDNGQVDPGATVPFGMVRVCPDSDPRSHSGYDYSVENISGISVNRMSGVGCGGAGGNICIRPALRRTYDLHILKHTEKAIPGYYETMLNNGVKVELTANRNVALERYTFPKGEESILTINFTSSFEHFISGSHRVSGRSQIEGDVESTNVCNHGRYKLFYNLVSNCPFIIKSDVDGQMVLSFDNRKSIPIEIRVSLSSVDQSSANKENNLIEKVSFEKIKSKAASLWEEKLSKISVKSLNTDDLAIFYTSLYRMYLSPVNVTSSDGQYLGTDGQVHTATESEYYSSWSIWDTYRTKFPLLVLMEPATMRDICQSLVTLYQTGKENWSTNFESTPTVRTEHAMILLLDAYKKGIQGIRFKSCYTQICKDAENLPMGTPDQKLESACDLWALAQIADIIGERNDAEKYRKLSEELFKNTWMKEFMTIDESYTKMKNNGLYQGTRWQYRWAAPQYLDKMIEWVGGQDTLNSQLTQFFEEHLYNQGNEPDIHVPYIFNKLGSPEKTQKVVRDLLSNEIIHKYGGNAEYPTPYFGRAYKNDPKGYCPEMDEDDGTMGAWYVFSSMGIYPMVVGKAEYELTSPLFDQITIKLPNEKTFTINTINRTSPDAPIKRITLNGTEYSTYQLSHDAIMQGGILNFEY